MAYDLSILDRVFWLFGLLSISAALAVVIAWPIVRLMERSLRKKRVGAAGVAPGRISDLYHHPNSALSGPSAGATRCGNPVRIKFSPGTGAE